MEGLSTFEELHRSFVSLGCFARPKGSKVAALSGLLILLA
jgi:hypothetical protein